MPFEPLKIGNLTAKVPIIQGGMGVGVSLHRLAGSVAREGGIGIISTAQIGYRRANFEKNSVQENLAAIEEEFRKAKEIAQGGVLGFNIMVAQFQHEKIVKKCVEVGADVVISGAGLPIHLPELVADSKTKIAPIISSAKAAKILLKIWAKRYARTADFIIVEGPLAGGHLGFKYDELDSSLEKMDHELKAIMEIVKNYEKQFNLKIPIIFAGGVYTKKDIEHFIKLGCSGVQMATRFVGTVECDAPDSFKKCYLEAGKDDIEIITSPVGMPGRAIKNSFTEKISQRKIPVERCNNCISLKLCNRKDNPFCISKSLIAAVSNNTEDALIFTGANAHLVDEITTVKKIFEELNV